MPKTETLFLRVWVPRWHQDDQIYNPAHADRSEVGRGLGSAWRVRVGSPLGLRRDGSGQVGGRSGARPDDSPR